MRHQRPWELGTVGLVVKAAWTARPGASRMLKVVRGQEMVPASSVGERVAQAVVEPVEGPPEAWGEVRERAPWVRALGHGCGSWTSAGRGR